jgi:hypothetical protein
VISEAKISAIAVSLLTGVGLTLVLSQALRDLGGALAISVPITLIMGGVLALFATDSIKKGRDASPSDPADSKQAPDGANEGK